MEQMLEWWIVFGFSLLALWGLRGLKKEDVKALLEISCWRVLKNEREWSLSVKTKSDK